jgi:hypothetical protein
VLAALHKPLSLEEFASKIIQLLTIRITSRTRFHLTAKSSPMDETVHAQSKAPKMPHQATVIYSKDRAVDSAGDGISQCRSQQAHVTQLAVPFYIACGRIASILIAWNNKFAP